MHSLGMDYTVEMGSPDKGCIVLPLAVAVAAEMFAGKGIDRDHVCLCMPLVVLGGVSHQKMHTLVQLRQQC